MTRASTESPAKEHTLPTDKSICSEVPMAFTISISHLGNPELEASLRSAIEDFFTHHPGDWEVDIFGSQENSAWELKVTSPKRHSGWGAKLYGEDGGHNLERVISEIKRITESLSRSEQ
jgi:hypothetical protein